MKKLVITGTLLSILSMPGVAETSLPALSRQAQQQVVTLSDTLQAAVRAGRLSGSPDEALALDALLAAWHETANGADFAAVQAAIDADLEKSPGNTPSRALLACLSVTASAKYLDALQGSSAESARTDLAFASSYATALHRRPPSAPEIQGGRTPADALALAEAVDAYAALPPEDQELDGAAWAHAVSVAAAPWLHPTRIDRHDKAEPLAAYAVAKAVRFGLLPAADRYRAAALYQADSDKPESSLAVVAANLLAATEIAQIADSTLGRDELVLGDAWFNSQKRRGLGGEDELFHYKWADQQNSGFSFFGSAFTRFGARLAQLEAPPSAASLHRARVYVIASPDIPAKNPDPHFMDKQSADAIEDWVRAGGVLLLMENDKNNSEFEHFNLLSERFGIHFNPVLRNTVEGRHFEQGRLEIPAATGGIFPEALSVYMKEICTIRVSGPAQAIYRDRGDVLMAVAHVGKGTVWAVVDPWLYNEYTDGRKLPPEYQDFAAAVDVARWALKQAR